MQTTCLRRALTATLFLATLGGQAVAEPSSGQYLAARQAAVNDDHAEAARYFAGAMASDPGNIALMESGMAAFVTSGQVDKAVAIAQTIRASGADSQLADLVVMTGAIRRSDFDGAMKIFDQGGGFSPLLDGLLRGWILMGQGRMSDGLAHFDSLQGGGALGVYGQNHKALALAMVGNFEAADDILRGDDRGSLRIDRGSLIAHAEILAELGKRDEAVAIIDQALSGATDPEVEALREKIASGENVTFTYIGRPEDGAAEVFYTLGEALSGDQNRPLSLLYGRLAQFLRPGSVKTLMLVAETLEAQGQHDLAIRAYGRVPTNHPMFFSAEIGRADALFASGNTEAAIEVLNGLARANPDNASVHMNLGDMLRRDGKFADARVAYTQAIDLTDDPQRQQWFLYYARGITNERTDHWTQAEADFRRALDLQPDQPLVLNYLGYSLVEKGESLDEAQAMIQRAVEQRPDDGYITDSLGWVLYRVGKFAEAVAPMERAVELMPVDPIINDHLGDVYWMVGRKLEADFQWRRALSFEPEEKDAARIRRKLEVGLDVVLEEEKAAPQDGN